MLQAFDAVSLDIPIEVVAAHFQKDPHILMSHPGAVKCFVDGSSIGCANYLYGNRALANASIKKDNPDMSDEQLAFSLEKMKAYGIVDFGDAIRFGISAINAARIEDFYAKMVAPGMVDKGVDITKSYTLEFANTCVAMSAKASLISL